MVTAHVISSDFLRPLAKGGKYRQAFLQPAPDGAGAEIAPGFPVTRIVEPGAGAAVFARPLAQRRGLGPLHVGFEAAEPEQTGTGSLIPPHRDPPLVGSRS